MKQKKTYTAPTTTATPLEPTYVIAGTYDVPADSSGNSSGGASGAAGKDIDGSSDSGSSSDDLWNLEW